MLLVQAGTAAVVVATMWLTPITPSAWSWFGVLLAGSVIHAEAAQGIERYRERAAEGAPYTHLQSVWYFAAVLVLPVPLIALLVAVSFGYACWRVHKGKVRVYRRVFSACTVVLGAAAAVLPVAAAAHGTAPYVMGLTGPLGAAAVVVAGVLYRVINYLLVLVPIAASNPDKPARTALGPASDQLLIAAAIGIGSGIVLVLVHEPWFAPLLMITVVALHLGLLLPQYKLAAQIDPRTGLCGMAWWETQARQEIDRAVRPGTPVGVLMLDLDHFKRVNDTHGHLAGDAVLRAVADTVKHAVRPTDVVGRWGGEEFAVLLPGADIAAVAATAERIRAMVAALSVTTTSKDDATVTITGLTVSIGAGAYPVHGGSLPHLLQVVDRALYRAKADGRDQVQLADATA
ncbi:diguanylate cyclase [Lentzea sp. NPDC102401]|uniref:GGDEF domain-containing protein n=1 Tax=Lentzea sp. NPDC102401 TaxID=3364128 RepID=UPI0038133A59